MKMLTADSDDNANIFVLHDVNLATRYCSHALLIYATGEIRQGTCAEALNAENLSDLYQHRLEEISHHGQRWFIAN